MNKLYVKIWIFLLILAITLVPLCSCGEDGGKVESSSEESTEERLPLAVGNKTEYTVVRPEINHRALGDLTLDIYNGILGLTGAEVAMSDDYLPAGESAEGRAEILLGYTNRAESLEVMDSIGHFDYAVRRVGSKIVIAAHTEETLRLAVKLFLELLTVEEVNGVKTLRLSEDRTVRSEDRFEFFFSQNPIENYRFVYPEGNDALKGYANQMAAKLKKYFSTDLKVVSDTEPATEYEILLGITNRQAFANCYTGAAAPDSSHFLIRAAGNFILIVGTQDISMRYACEYFLNTLMVQGYSNCFNLQDGLNDYRIAYPEDPYKALTKDADLRVMSYNILSKALSPDKADILERRDQVFFLLRYYLPDVVGIQEASDKGWGLIKQEMSDIYGVVDHMTPAGECSYTGLIYNKSTVRFIESENIVYSVGNKRIRIFAWARFEHLATGKEFIAVSTHWDVQSFNRPQHAQEMTELVNGLRLKYPDLPIFTTGDFNANEDAVIYQTYLSATSQTDARTTAKKVGNTIGTAAIDHVTSTKNVDTLFYQYVKNDLTLVASDHNPVYADFRFR